MYKTVTEMGAETHQQARHDVFKCIPNATKGLTATVKLKSTWFNKT